MGGGRYLLKLASCGPPGVVSMVTNFLDPGWCSPCTPPALDIQWTSTVDNPFTLKKESFIKKEIKTNIKPGNSLIFFNIHVMVKGLIGYSFQNARNSL